MKDKLIANYNTLGTELYGKQWPSVRRHAIERFSGGQTSKADELDEGTIERLTNQLVKLKNYQRERKP